MKANLQKTIFNFIKSIALFLIPQLLHRQLRTKFLTYHKACHMLCAAWSRISFPVHTKTAKNKTGNHLPTTDTNWHNWTINYCTIVCLLARVEFCFNCNISTAPYLCSSCIIQKLESVKNCGKFYSKEGLEKKWKLILNGMPLPGALRGSKNV